MTPVWGHNDNAFAVISDFVSTRIWGKPRPFLGNTAMGVISGKDLVAGVVFSNYDSDAGVIEMSAASDNARWLTRPILWGMFSYAFRQMKCQAVVLRTDPANTRLARILTAYGFDRYDIPRLRGRDKSEALFILADDVWRNNGFHKENV